VEPVLPAVAGQAETTANQVVAPAAIAAAAEVLGQTALAAEVAAEPAAGK
tara:strand:+ start:1932 stop:2081 length:150 start_codon:yes stop_codon:yes gene_type:complete